MILNANERGNAGELAKHLLNDRDNEHVELHELRGFVSETLSGAMKEVEAVARGTRCQKFLFSVSLNPPEAETPSIEAFERAAAKIEKDLGLEGQPRAIVFHEKEGRRHAHVIWSKIDGQEMKAINLSFYKRKLTEISKQLYLEHGWELPKGLRDKQNRDPLSFTLAEWQQAKRAKHDPKQMKAMIRECWTQSDDRKSFEAALRKNGLWLARGDRRGYVAIDWRGEVYSLSRTTGAKTKELKARLGIPKDLPKTDDVKALITEQLNSKLKAWAKQVEAEARRSRLSSNFQREQMVQRHRDARDKLKKEHTNRWLDEERARTARQPKGMRALWGWITGKNKKIRQINEAEIGKANKRDRSERHKLITKQLEERRRFQKQIKQAREKERSELHALNQEMAMLLMRTRGTNALLKQVRRGKNIKSQRTTRRQDRQGGRDNDLGPDFDPS